MKRHVGMFEKTVIFKGLEPVFYKSRRRDDFHGQRRGYLPSFLVESFDLGYSRHFKINLLAYQIIKRDYLLQNIRPGLPFPERLFGEIGGKTMCFVLTYLMRVGEDAELYEPQTFRKLLRRMIGGPGSGINYVHKFLVMGYIVKDQLHHR